jgi:hypothetical protein
MEEEKRRQTAEKNKKNLFGIKHTISVLKYA